jgi:predicted phosphodiesterase
MIRLAHLSDLHLGAGPQRLRAAARLVNELNASAVDHVVITGDITHNGRTEDFEEARALFAALKRDGRLTMVPGNHDRGTDDAAEQITKGRRVWVKRRPGLYLICVDSTAPHNFVSFRAHGSLCQRTLAMVDDALRGAQPGEQVVMALHHHLIRLPVETIGEWFADQFGWPHASELPLGRRLLELALGRCDLVLHGHRHVPRRFEIPNARPLTVCNAGSSTELNAFRVLRLANGHRLESQWWPERREHARELLPALAIA